MNNESFFIQFLMTFFVCTTCIGVGMGYLGMLFLPDARFGYDGLFAPIIIGFLSALLGLITHTNKELSIRQALIRKIIHLLLIELMILGLNWLSIGFMGLSLTLSIAFSILVIYVVTDLVVYLIDRRSAQKFNLALQSFKERKPS